MKHMFAKAAAAGSVLALALTGCGGGSPSASTAESSGSGSSSSSGDGSLTQLTVGVIPIAPSAAVQLGINEGIFEKHGLDIELETGQGGAAMLPAVSSGGMDIAVGNPLSVILAHTKGLDIGILTGYTHANKQGQDVTGVVTAADSGIESAADLEGKTVSVNTLNGQGDVTIKEAVAQDGGDPSKVQFVEVAFPDAQAQVENGNIDAAWMAEPFLTKALESGMEVATYNYQETIPGLSTMVTFSSKKFVEGNPETAEAWRAAVGEALDYAQQNPDEVRAILPEFLKMNEKLAKDLPLENHSAKVDRQMLQQLTDLMVKYGVVDKEPNMDEVIFD